MSFTIQWLKTRNSSLNAFTAQTQKPREHRLEQLGSVQSHTFQVFQQSSAAVSMTRNQHSPAFPYLWHHGAVPIRQHSVQHLLQALCSGKVLFWHVASGVSAVIVDFQEVRVGFINRRWSDGVAPSPQLHLFLSVLQSHIGPVQANQGTIVALVQSPGLDHGDPLLPHGLQHQPCCVDGAAE